MKSESFDQKTLTFGLKNFGYSTAEAIADIIDNSIEANAKNIEILFWEGTPAPWIAVIDDGEGMSKIELENAIKIKKKQNTNTNSVKLSKFGFGLKTASFSQCAKIIIITKKNNQTNFKVLKSNLITEDVGLISIFKKFKYIEKKFNERCARSGTIIIWENLDDNITGKNINTNRPHAIFYEKGKIFSEHAATHFHHFFDKIKIYYNGIPLAKWDPFNENLKNLKIFDKKKIKVGDYYITIQGYVYPKEDDFDNIELYEKIAGPVGWFDSQGIYLYRENRLLTHGGWFGLRLNGSNPWQKETRFEKCRITLHYDSRLDHYFRPNIQKNTSEIPALIRHQVAMYCDEVRSFCLKKKSRKASTIDLIEESEGILNQGDNGKIELNLNHPNIDILINKNLSPKKREFILSQISKEIKKINNA